MAVNPKWSKSLQGIALWVLRIISSDLELHFDKELRFFRKKRSSDSFSEQDRKEYSCIVRNVKFLQIQVKGFADFC